MASQSSIALLNTTQITLTQFVYSNSRSASQVPCLDDAFPVDPALCMLIYSVQVQLSAPSWLACFP